MISRRFIGRFIACFSLFILTFQSVSAQEKPQPLTLNDILAKLTFTSRIDKTAEQINAKLIEEIKKRKVGFELSEDDEQNLRTRGGNPALIKAVKANFSKTRSPDGPYLKSALDLWGCNSKTDLASRKQCLNIARKFIRYFKDDPSTAHEYNELESYIQKMDELIKRTVAPKKAVKTSDVESFPNPDLPLFIEQIALYGQFIACFPKTDPASRRSCLKVAKEFFDKFKDDAEVKLQIDYFREYIPLAEKMIAEIEKKEELDKSINEFNYCLKKPDLESKKLCLALAKELLNREGTEPITEQLKRVIQDLEKTIAEMSKNP